jgi:hypothetical protein
MLHSSSTPPERAEKWARLQFDDEPYDLCLFCTDAVRALAAVRKPI